MLYTHDVVLHCNFTTRDSDATVVEHGERHIDESWFKIVRFVGMRMVQYRGRQELEIRGWEDGCERQGAMRQANTYSKTKVCGRVLIYNLPNPRMRSTIWVELWCLF
jgi:hypothetical protein